MKRQRLLSKLSLLLLGGFLSLGIVNGFTSNYVKSEADGSTCICSDTITSNLLAATSTSYKDFSKVNHSTGSAIASYAEYAGNTSKTTSSSIGLRQTNNNSGIVSTRSGGLLNSVTVEWLSSSSSGKSIIVYGKNTAYSSATDLYNSSTCGTQIGTIDYDDNETTINFTDDYYYIGLASGYGTAYILSFSISYTQSSSDFSFSVEPNKTTIQVGEAFSHDGNIPHLSYLGSTISELTDGDLNYSNPDMSQLPQIVTASYSIRNTNPIEQLQDSYEITLEATPYIDSNPSSISGYSGCDSIEITVTAHNFVPTGYEWSVVDSTIASITSGGNNVGSANLLAAGTTEIRCTVSGSDSPLVCVIPVSVTESILTLSETSISVKIGKTYSVSSSINFDSSAEYSITTSPDSNIATANINSSTGDIVVSGVGTGNTSLVVQASSSNGTATATLNIVTRTTVGYRLITSINQLKPGYKCLILDSTKAKTMAAFTNKDSRPSTDVTFLNIDQTLIEDDPKYAPLVLGKCLKDSNEYWTFYDFGSDTYHYLCSRKSYTNLYTRETIEDPTAYHADGQWTINFNDGTNTATIQSLVSDRYIAVSSGMDYFACYTSSQNLYIYQEEEKTLSSISVTEEPTKVEYYVGEQFDSTGIKVSAIFDDSSSFVDAEYFCTYNKTTFTEEGTVPVTVICTLNGEVKSTTFNVSVLSSGVVGVSVKTKPTKMIYDVGETFDVTGMEVYEVHSNGTENLLSSSQYSVSPADGTILDADMTTVTVTYVVDDSTFTDTFEITINYDAKVYHKVTSSLVDYSGTYIIASRNSSNEGISFANVEGMKNYNSITITDNTIIGKSMAFDAITITLEKQYDSSNKFIGYYALINGGENDGLHMYATSSSPLSFSSTSSYKSHPISVVSNGNGFSLMCEGKVFGYSSSLSVDRFGFYTITDDNAALYKIDTPATAIIEAKAFAKEFNECEVCGTDDNTPAISSVWNVEWASYKALSIDARAALANRDTFDGDSDTEAFYEKYDTILDKAEIRGNLNDFYDFLSGQYKTQSANVVKQVNVDASNVSIVVISVASMLVVLALGSVAFITLYRKKKHN